MERINYERHHERYQLLINSREWQKLRASKLKKKPLCERCLKERRYVTATEVHHIVPIESVYNIRHMARLAYDWKNLQSLCHECHIRVHKELRSRGKKANKKRQQSRLDDFWERFGLNEYKIKDKDDESSSP